MNAPLATLNEEPPVIEIHNVVKEYRLGAFEGLRTLGRRLLGRSVPDQQKFRALDDISLTIRRGEVVGIIGHNGAGKSTLLKLLCRITNPTSGSIKVNGRIAPLIEVGAGLVGDMTGRENIYLNATILGLKRAEIDAKVDEIIEFSELEQFIDTPIKRYSSGMQVRLGFAIATAIDCDVLIVDEVLAVGDITFQQKCLDRIASYIQGRQRTVIIVGHNIRQLERVCDRMIMLDHGSLLMDGDTLSVATKYFADAQKSVFSSHTSTFVGLVPQESVEFIQVLSIELGTGNEAHTPIPTMHAPLEVRITFRSERDLVQPEFVVGVHTLDFIHVLSIGNASDRNRPSFDKGTHEVCVLVYDLPLRPGVYGLRLAIINDFRQIMWYAENILPVTISAGDHEIALLPEASLIDAPCQWRYSLNQHAPNDVAQQSKASE